MLRLGKWSNLRLRTKSLIAVAAPATATVVIACAAYIVATRTAAEEAWVRRSLLVSQEIQRLKGSEAAASTEVRAYFITADDSFASSARATIAAFDATRLKLEHLTADNASQTRRLSQIAALQLSSMESIYSDIGRFQAGALPFERIRAALRSADTARLEMERLLNAMEAEETRLLDVRFRRVESLRAEGGNAIAILASCGVFGGVAISLLFASGIAKRVVKLQANLSRLATGGVLDPLPRGHDEIGALGEGMAGTAAILKYRTAALENALHGIAHADASGQRLVFNRAYAELAGLPDFQETASIVETVHPDDRVNVERAVRLMRVNGRAETDARMMRAGGGLTEVTMTLIAPPQDEREGYYVFMRDNRRSKEAEAALVRAKDAAIASNTAKSGFLAKVSHDIRTPLNAILGAADLLSHTSLSPDQSEYVNMFQRNCRRLGQLINDFLDFSRIEAGAVQIQKVPCRMSEIVEDAIATFRESAARKNIALGIEIDPSIPEWIMVDPLRIQQVLINLLSNAVKFTLAGRVDITAQRIGTQNERIRIQVCDTGPGIDPADQERIFAAFAQLTDGDRAHNGSGLGLTICRELVELMGGEIGLLSHVSGGSIFHFDLLLEAAAAATPAASHPAENGDAAQYSLDEPARILVAEDAADNRLLIEHYLREEPVELSFAVDGREAVESGRTGMFDLILMDIDMPGVDGYAAAKLIREWQTKHDTIPTPIIALSAHAMREAVLASMDAGCIEHLAKPVDRSTLLRTIRRHALTKIARAAPKPERRELAAGVASLVPVYLASKPKQIEEAQACLASKDFEPIRRFGHNLKGTGGGYGFPRIEELGREIECAAGARDENLIGIQLEALYRFVAQAHEANSPKKPVPTGP